MRKNYFTGVQRVITRATDVMVNMLLWKRDLIRELADKIPYEMIEAGCPLTEFSLNPTEFLRFMQTPGAEYEPLDEFKLFSGKDAAGTEYFFATFLNDEENMDFVSIFRREVNGIIEVLATNDEDGQNEWVPEKFPDLDITTPDLSQASEWSM